MNNEEMKELKQVLNEDPSDTSNENKTPPVDMKNINGEARQWRGTGAIIVSVLFSLGTAFTVRFAYTSNMLEGGWGTIIGWAIIFLLFCPILSVLFALAMAWASVSKKEWCVRLVVISALLGVLGVTDCIVAAMFNGTFLCPVCVDYADKEHVKPYKW